MPKKSLPIKELKQKLLDLLNQRSLQSNSEDTASEGDPSVPQPNLLSNYKYSPGFEEKKDLKYYYESPQFTKSSQLLISGLTIIFLALTFVNFLLNKKVANRRDSLYEKQSVLENSAETLESLRVISEKIDLYKAYIQDHKSFSDYSSAFITPNNNLRYYNVRLDRSVVEVQGETSSPLTFSLLVDEYLKKDFVNSIVLKNASLDTELNVYVLNFEVNLQ